MLYYPLRAFCLVSTVGRSARAGPRIEQLCRVAHLTGR